MINICTPRQKLSLVLGFKVDIVSFIWCLGISYSSFIDTKRFQSCTTATCWVCFLTDKYLNLETALHFANEKKGHKFVCLLPSRILFYFLINSYVLYYK